MVNIPDKPINSHKPVRIALLGPSNSGKSSFVQRAVHNTFLETYYPTRNIVPAVFEFRPTNPTSRQILDFNASLSHMEDMNADSSLRVGYATSVTLHHNELIRLSDRNYPKNSTHNEIYTTLSNEGSQKENRTSFKAQDPALSPVPSLVSYNPPFTTPILTELVDSPPYNRRQTVPFLEASLDAKLPSEFLHRLALEPRKNIQVQPLLVASGASEMNGSIDGYLFFYSCVPSLNPPEYSESPETKDGKATEEETTFEKLTESNDPISILKSIKLAVVDAWKDYNRYKKNWLDGEECDVYSLSNTIKSLWKSGSSKVPTNPPRIEKTESGRTTASSVDEKVIHELQNYRDLPPVTIVCTHADSPLKSPVLIEKGKKLAREWNCGFVLMSNLSGSNAQECLALTIREIAERNKSRSSSNNKRNKLVQKLMQMT
ncbi:hypothetical protein LJB42_002625 [Komagataella kurtzmanii]|nr:hypothetical protein LJB42_002625 [Komagataella kurtzmanii]